MADLFYYDSGYLTPDGYFTYTADAASAMQSSATMTVACGVIKQAQAALTSAVSVTAIISHIEGADLFAFSEASLAAQVDRIRDNNIAVSGVFDAAIDASRIIHVSADDNVTATLVADNLRVRYSEAAVDAAFSLAADVSMVPGGAVIEASGAWTATSGWDCKATRKTNIVDVDVASAFALDSTAQRIAGLDSAFESQAIQNTINSRTRSFDSALSSSASVSVSLSQIKQFDSAPTATASLSATISHIEGADLQAFSNASLSASADRIRATAITATSSASLSATIEKTQQGAGQLSSTASLTATALKIQTLAVAMTSTASMAASGYLANKRPRGSTAVNNITTSTTQKMFGTHSLYRPDSTSRLNIDSTTDFGIAANEDFIIEFFYYPTYTLAAGEKYIMDYKSSAGNTVWRFGYSSTNTILFFEFWNGSSLNRVFLGPGNNNSVSINNWNYIKAYRSGSTISLILNVYSSGVWHGANNVGNWLNYSSAIKDGSFPGTLSIGYSSSNVATGYYDELYMAKGTTSFGQPSSGSSYAALNSGTEPTTQFLFHFDGNYTDTTTGTLNATATLNSSATLSATPDNRIRSASAALSANGFVVAATGRIRPEVAALDSAFTLTAAVDKIKYASADLSSAFTLTTDALDLDLAQANLSSAFTLSASALASKKATASLSSSASIVARPDRTYLQLFGRTNTFPAPNNAGYITGTGGTLELATQTGTTYGIAPVTINFWFQLPDYATMPSVWGYEVYSDMTSSSQNVAIELHSDGTNRWVYIQGLIKYWHGGYEYSQGFSNNYYIPAGTDLSQWTNFHGSLLPTISQTYNGSTSSYPSATFEDAYINGSLVEASNTVSLYQAFDGSQPAATWFVPVLYTTGDTTLDAGLWGDPDNLYQLNLDSIWIKRQSTAAIDQFIVNGEEAFITKTGQTANGTTPNIWLPWGTLNDQASTAPTWNYTTVNHVLYRMIKLAQASLSSAFTQTTRVDRVRPATGAWDSQASLTATALRIKNPGAKALTSTATLISNANKIVQGNAGLTSAFTQVTNAIKTARGILNAQATATLTAQAVKYRPAQAALSSTATQEISAIKTSRATSALTSTATQTSTALRIKQLSATLVTTGSELTIAVKTGQGLIHADMTATMVVNAVKTTNTSSTEVVTASLTANAISLVIGQASLNANATAQANPTYLRHTEVHAQSTATMQITAVKTSRAQANLTSQATQTTTTNNSKIARITANLTSQATQVTNNMIVRLGKADLIAEASIPFALGGVMVRFEADLVCEGFELVAGQIIHIDEYYQIRIRPEVRALSIKQETRGILIKPESRVNIIKGTPAL